MKDSITEVENIAQRGKELLRKNSMTSDEVMTAAQLALAVYEDKPEVNGWTPIPLDKLDVPKGYKPNGHYINSNACAFVRETIINGEKSLALVFKGTDMWSPEDWIDNITHINDHYKKMRPLVDAVDKYAKEHGVNRIIVTGHSLGGAMAAIYMHEHLSGRKAQDGIRYDAVTFGSPGAVFPDKATDKRILAFRHDKDIVPKVVSLKAWGDAYRSPGRIIEITEKNSQRFSGITGGIKAHSMNAYVDTMIAMKFDGTLDKIVKTNSDITVSRNIVSDKHIETDISYRPDSKRMTGKKPQDPLYTDPGLQEVLEEQAIRRQIGARAYDEEELHKIGPRPLAR